MKIRDQRYLICDKNIKDNRGFEIDNIIKLTLYKDIGVQLSESIGEIVLLHTGCLLLLHS